MLGCTLANLLDDCKVDKLEELTPGVVKKNMVYACAPKSEQWRVPLAMELQRLRDDVSCLEGFSLGEIEDMLASVSEM